MKVNLIVASVLGLLIGCNYAPSKEMTVEVYQTSAEGDKLKLIKSEPEAESTFEVKINPDQKFQEITGFGGAFTESSAYLLNNLSKEKRDEVIDSYFGNSGAQYSLTRTHMNSCDFSLSNYSYTPLENDTLLSSFSIEEDIDDIIPMIKDAQKVSSEGFKILASPWTAPPWMKDNKDWKGGKLLPEYYPSWALFFSKYAKAYEEQGIYIWGFTVENEPLGNDSNWESMHFTPEETADFVKNHLGPQLKEDNIDVNLLVYDQNRGEELKEWADVLLTDPELDQYIYGTAVHWYSSTVDWFPESLNYTHEIAPEKHILHTEGCIDAEVPHWQEDEWYWSKEATDWGWDWASEENKPNHPKYVPVYRYARDIIGCLNSSVEGWIDWNMVLDRKGGPNWANNWCIAPVIVDVELDEVYYTPLFYTMAHFSKFIRPGARRIGLESTNDDLMLTAVENSDGSIVLIALNMNTEASTFELVLNEEKERITISPQSLQSVIIK